MRLKRFAILAAMFAAPLAAAAPSVAEYTTLPKYDTLAISPGGTRLAFTQREGNNASLIIVDFPSMKVDKSISFGVKTDIDEIFWIDEKRLLMQPARFAPEFKAYKMRTGEIVRVDVEKGKVDVIFGFLADVTNRGTHVSKREATNMPGQILSMKTGDPDEVLVETVGAGMGEDVNAAYRMNLNSGKLDTVASSPVRGSRFVTGPDLRVSVLYGVNDENETVVYHLPAKGKPGCCNWVKKIASKDEAGDFFPIAWAGKDEVYYAIDSRDAPTRGVFLWDAEANSQRLLYRHPEVDLYPAAVDPQGRPWLFAGSGTRPVYWYPDPNHPLARMHQTLAKGLPQDQVSVVSETDDLSVAVVRIDSARRPPTYLVVDVSTAKPLQVLPAYPNLKPQDMAPVNPIEFAARDGRKIRGYLTTPLSADGKPGRKMPTVVVVHGGPFGIYDDYGYEFERQLFASRGYAVLQVNFRGSGGRGREFTRAGYGEWGRAIQDDITDGVRWAIQEGVADASRICIYGASFGAYSALVGASREPAMFKCAVGMAGVYDLPLLYSRGDIEKSRRGVNYLKDAVGDDEQELRARSPVYSAKAITAKVMLLHGVEDFRAPIEHAKRMREALIEAGNPPEWIVEGGEDHGFFNPENRVGAYTRILEFIDRNIGH